MKTCYFVVTIIFLLSFSMNASAEVKKGKNSRPNIVFILADDLGYADLGCTGSDLYQTPNIDQLACEAMYFSQSYSAHPTCQPSRLV